MAAPLYSMDAFVTQKVVPEIIDAVPPSKLLVTFGAINLDPGATLAPTQVKDEPTVNFVPEVGALYTLMMFDHDVPSTSDHGLADFLHWQVINIHGRDVSNGLAVAQYIGSGPPKGSGYHRYTLLMLKQPNGQLDPSQFTVITNKSANGRPNFTTRAFISQHGLEVVAGNFFLAQWDDYVPQLQAQLGFTPAP